MPFPHSYVELVGHRAWPSRHAPIPRADRSIHPPVRWGTPVITRWRQTDSSFGGRAETVRQLRESASQIFAATCIYLCVCVCEYVCRSLRLFNGSETHREADASRRLIYLLTGKKNCRYHRNRRVFLRKSSGDKRVKFGPPEDSVARRTSRGSRRSRINFPEQFAEGLRDHRQTTSDSRTHPWRALESIWGTRGILVFNLI